MDKKKLGVAIAGSILLVSAGLGIGYSFIPQPEPIVQYVNVTSAVEPVVCEPCNVCEPEVITQTIVNETVKEVLVDNGKLDLVLDHIYDNNGNIEYITTDLDNDEIAEIADRIIFVNEIKQLAVDYVKDNLFDELDKEVVTLNDNSTEKLDDSDMERLKIDDEQDEVSIEDIDFDDSDAELKITFRFEQDDVRYEGDCIVSVKDGEIDDFEEINVKER